MIPDVDIERYVDTLKTAVLHDPKMSQAGVTRRDMYAFLYTKTVEEGTFVPVEWRDRVISILLNAWFTYDVLQSAIEDPYISDIHVFGTTTVLKRNGENFESTETKFRSEEAIHEFLNRQLDGTPYSFSMADPIVDAILPGGYRLNAIGGPSTRYTVRGEDGRITTEERTMVTIRKPIFPFSLDELVRLRLFDAQTRSFIRLLMTLGDSFILAGGVGSAKTTLMNAMTEDIPKGLVNIVIEEIPEMTPLCDWAVRLSDKAPNVEGKGGIDMRKNILNSLRMDGDNGFIGEVRSADIAYLFLRMFLIVKRQTGTTFHAHIGNERGVDNVLTRFILEAAEGAGGRTSFLNIASMMVDQIRFIFTLRETKHGKRMMEIAEIVGFDFLDQALLWQPVMNYDLRSDQFVFHGISDSMRARVDMDGLTTDLPSNTQPVQRYRIAT